MLDTEVCCHLKCGETGGQGLSSILCLKPLVSQGYRVATASFSSAREQWRNFQSQSHQETYPFATFLCINSFSPANLGYFGNLRGQSPAVVRPQEPILQSSGLPVWFSILWVLIKIALIFVFSLKWMLGSFLNCYLHIHILPQELFYW